MELSFNYVRPGVFNLPQSDWWGFDPSESRYLEPHWTMAHIAVDMDLFQSVGQARKNGWGDPIPEGYTERFKIGKMNKALFIHNPPDWFLNGF